MNPPEEQTYTVDGIRMTAEQIVELAREYGFSGHKAENAAKFLEVWEYDVHEPGEKHDK